MGNKRKDTEDNTSEETEVEVSQEKSKPEYEASKGTGKEHWGEGGKFRITPSGRRVRVKEKE